MILYLIRHAHAESGSAYMPDYERNLVSAGIMAAARTGRYLREKTPDGIAAIVSSSANRASQTASIVAEQLNFDPGAIQTDKALFDQGLKAYLANVNALPDSSPTAVLVGHNPDITYFAEYLTHETIEAMGKGDIVAIELAEGLTWANASARTGRLLWHWTPN